MATVATVGAIVVCIVASAMACAAASIGAWVVRSAAEIEEQGSWEAARGAILADLLVTVLMFGIFFPAGRFFDEVAMAMWPTGSRGLWWLGRGMVGAWDVAAFIGGKLGRC